ncbi:MAG: integrase [Idiomarina sp.]|uniref:hypothetical protein n=1 Tax=Idiomarina sp. TaxID=1874361 RepID=UPI000C50E80A|nr:hypothetical protein [Idiomarina sp.]MBT43579.1 integrase [Idiomarina sp.]
MPIERILSEHEINQVIKRNNKPPFAYRNAAIVLASTYWCLTPFELSELRLQDVMDKTGDFFSVWTLPAHASQNGEPRELRTADHIASVMGRYIKWWEDNDLYGTGQASYRGRDRMAPFILNDNYEPYALTKRSAGDRARHPVSMNKKLNSLLKTAGFDNATASTFRDSGIKLHWDNGAKYNDLKQFTGIKSKKAIDAKVRPHEAELTSVLSKVFRNIQ